MPEVLSLPGLPIVRPSIVVPGAADALRKFPEFCRHLTIDSKEYGVCKLQLWGTQARLIQEVQRGIAEDVRTYVILKGRQDGGSTILLALDLYWLQKFAGLQGTLIADTDKNMVKWRDELNTMYEGLPRGWRQGKEAHNSSLFKWTNRSRLLYQVAGIRNSSGKSAPVGQGRGLNYIHAEELGSWADPEQVDRLRVSKAKKHPHRLFFFISTARGYNVFYDMWQDAQRATSVRPIFLGWWMNEQNQVERDSMQFKVYGQGKLTGEERIWTKVVKKLYGVEILPEQIAWWRWQHAEEIPDEATMHQEHPCLPEHAFQATGSQFMGPARIAELAEQAKAAHEPEWFSYSFGPTIDDPRTILTESNRSAGQLAIWEDPIDGAPYVVSGDPAYGASVDSDRFCAQVWRADGRRLVQVAEFVNVVMNTKHFAWVLSHLAGVYRNAFLICELTGPGYHVWQEMQDLQTYGWGTANPSSPQVTDLIQGIQHYLWRRADSMRPQWSFQWQSTPRYREALMHQFRSELESGSLVIRSQALVQECRDLRNEDGDIRAHGRAKDDRALAAAMATEAWLRWVIPSLGLPSPREPEGPTTVTGKLLVNFFQGIGRPPREEDDF